MSFAVKAERVRSVQPHPNADRLDIIQVLDWYCVAGKDTFKPGDLCVYFPIDSILPLDVENAIFGPDAKVRLHKSRVRTIKLRGSISQGLAVDLQTLYDAELLWNDPVEGDDLTSDLRVAKYEPPEPPAAMRGQQAPKRDRNPHFRAYTDISNIKYYGDAFAAGEPVYVTEKIHGTSFRAGKVPFVANTFFKKIRKFLGLTPKYEFVFGSRRVQLQDKTRPGGSRYYEQGSNLDTGAPVGNVYLEAVKKYNLRNVIPDGFVLYGEIYGDGIQKNYTYGCKAGERKLVAYDIAAVGTDSQTYFSPVDFVHMAGRLGVPVVPAIPVPNGYNLEDIKALTKGPSILAPQQRVREGVVVKPMHEDRSHPQVGRLVLKVISDEYLLNNQTDFH